ncbi:response regulator, partial [Salmonella enterica subsp. enterica serovar Typhimurium]|nr:response regulator [Salmonella enterica subsp. enterica serovar Typhimurium]
IVEDHALVREGMAQTLARLGAEWCVIEASDAAQALAVIDGGAEVDLVLTDLMLPDGQGIELLADFGSRPAPAIVVVTGYASIESAIEAMRAGATDYLIKPLDHERLRGILSRMPKTEVLREEIGELRSELIRLGHFGHMLGNSPAMRRIYNQIDRVAPTSATVLLIGESGTGKEVVAQTLHDLSRRKRQPF